MIATVLIVGIVRSERIADWLGRTGQRVVSWIMRRLGRTDAPDVAGAIHRFRDQLGFVIRRRGLGFTRHVGHLAVRLGGRAHRRAPDDGDPGERADPGRRLRRLRARHGHHDHPAVARRRRCARAAVHLRAQRDRRPEYESAITAGVFLYRLYYWFLPIPLAWILLKVARRGRSMLPTTAELKAAAHG